MFLNLKEKTNHFGIIEDDTMATVSVMLQCVFDLLAPSAYIIVFPYKSVGSYVLLYQSPQEQSVNHW